MGWEKEVGTCFQKWKYLSWIFFISTARWENVWLQNMAQKAPRNKVADVEARRPAAALATSSLPEVPLESHLTSLGLSFPFPNMESILSTPCNPCGGRMGMDMVGHC